MNRVTIDQALQELSIQAADGAMRELYKRAYNIASQTAHILIRGDSGAGKDVLARFIHKVGLRCNQPFVQVHCGSIPDSLFESELFGYVQGAFSGASLGGKRGYVELAHKGILYLDGVEHLSLSNQVKLLRFLQSGEIQPVGGEGTKVVDVQIISASISNLRTEIQAKQFREDVYYRICVVEFVIPPLFQRHEDIVAIANQALQTFSKEYQVLRSFTSEVVSYLCQQSWSGNVRQLIHYVQQLCLLNIPEQPDVAYLQEHVPIRTLQRRIYKEGDQPCTPLQQAVANFEKEYIQEALSQSKTLVEAAQRLDIPLSTLKRKKKQYQLYKYPRYLR